MMSSENVAIPAASPLRRMSGIATIRPKPAAMPPPIKSAPMNGNSVFTSHSGWSNGGRLFNSGGIVSSAAVYAPTAMKLMCPKDRTPEFPEKMYRPTTTTMKISSSVAVRWVGSVPPDAMPVRTTTRTISANSGQIRFTVATPPSP